MTLYKVAIKTLLDGVMQAPGGPEEDPTGGFALGGWMFNYADETTDISTAGFDGKDRELLLGRRTYDIFEAFWPYQPQEDPVAQTLNAATKHVASRTATQLQWNNSRLLMGDVVPAITALKALPGPHLQVIGSGNLLQTLQAAALVDEYHVWTFPVVLVRSRVSNSGVVMSTYVPDGDITPGSFATSEPSAMELTRRRRVAGGVW